MHKFIISNDCEFRHGAIDFHKELLENNETNCLGGGFVKFDFDNKHMILFGKSFDFGYPKIDMLTNDSFDWRYEGWTWEYDYYI